MSAKSREGAVAARRIGLERYLDGKRENPELGKPASQRTDAPYPAKVPAKLRFTRDRYGITLGFSENRKDRRRHG